MDTSVSGNKIDKKFWLFYGIFFKKCRFLYHQCSCSFMLGLLLKEIAQRLPWLCKVYVELINYLIETNLIKCTYTRSFLATLHFVSKNIVHKWVALEIVTLDFSIQNCGEENEQKPFLGSCLCSVTFAGLQGSSLQYSQTFFFFLGGLEP